MRVIKKKYRVLTACVLAGLLMAAAPGIGRSIRAAESVDMTKTGTLKLSLGTEDSLEMALDMAQMREPLQVRLWKLADMTETGNYEFQGAFQGLTMEEDSWKTLQEEAFDLIYERDEEGKTEGEAKVAPTFTAAAEVGAEGTLTLEKELSGLDLGLYLVVLDTAESPKYEYRFTPMVVSLPWSEYQYVGSGASDTWQYEREATLKPDRAPRLGDIKIVKTLTSYNASMGDATFVFDVTAADPESGEILYSNVFSATFSAVGVKEILVEDLPAGAEVTVREVYSGANCQITASDEGPKIVAADGMEGTEEPVTFRFANAYNEEAKNGYGVENRFRYDTEAEAYVWTTDREDITGEEQP